MFTAINAQIKQVAIMVPPQMVSVILKDAALLLSKLSHFKSDGQASQVNAPDAQGGAAGDHLSQFIQRNDRGHLREFLFEVGKN
jgi:hypothetical protein